MPTNSPSRSPADGDVILVAGQSGRALAAAARRAGLRPLVTDLFGDADTRSLALAYRPVGGRFGRGVNGRGLLAALDELVAAAPAPPLGIVLGSGFEAAPALIQEIAARHRLLGASAAAVRALKDPAGWAALLDRLNVPHPPISLTAVPDWRDWLVKRAGASGGGHIRRAGPGPPPPGSYLQRRVPGAPLSFAFLADGHAARIIAVTSQWAEPGARAPFRYAGALAPGSCPAAIREAAQAALDGIVAATGLRGLASADCLVQGDANRDDSWSLLEINPRPGATLDVLDRRRTPLLLDHIEACCGRLGPVEAAQGMAHLAAGGAAATTILHAGRILPLMPAIDWPEFVRDRPQAGSRIGAGAPICTVFAEADHPAEVLALLSRRVGAVRAMVEGGEANHASILEAILEAAERQRPRRPLGRPARR
jgi:predicted ATP-grasp superfamily ATP-dependent carboligase